MRKAGQGAGEKICPYCRTAIEPGSPTVVCPQCGIPHHQDCWQENGRCTTFGCQGGGPGLSPLGGARQPTRGDTRQLPDRPCPQCGFTMHPYETTCPYCRTPLFGGRPEPYQPAGRYGSLPLRPSRGGTILTYGILSFVCMCMLFGIAAWSMANEDLKAMNAGAMEESGRAATEAGRILGIVSVCLEGTLLFLWLMGSMAGR